MPSEVNQAELLIKEATKHLNGGPIPGSPKNAWCAYFVWQCAKKAGIPSSVIPYNQNLAYGMKEHYRRQGRYFTPGKGTPQRGDLIFFYYPNKRHKYNISHVGIVTGVNGSQVSTIEGNKPNGRGGYCGNGSYNYLKNSAVKGFARPPYSGVVEAFNTDYGEGGGQEITRTVYREISPGTRKEYVATENFDNLDTNYEPTGTVQVMVGKRKSNEVQRIPVTDPVEWELVREGSPGRLTFSYVKGMFDADGNEIKVNIQEGDPVLVKAGEKDVFYGYVFSKRRTKDGLIEVTAYDQLRYFANTDTYIYEDMTAGELLKMICVDYGHTYGEIEDTGYRISGVASGQKLFDIMRDVIGRTAEYTDHLYVLYDDCGRIRLRDVEKMKINYLLCAQTMGDYDYTSSIEDTATVVQVAVDNREAGERQVTFTRSQADIDKWRVLMLYETRTDDFMIDEIVRALWNWHSGKKRTLRVSDAVGDLRVRPGVRIVVQLDLGDIVVSNMLMVNAVTHKFGEGSHLMDMDLIGGDFNE